MAETILDAGRLNERLELLELKETSPGVWTWESAGLLWGAVEADGGKNLFSAVGIGARNARLVVRRRALTLHQAMRWRGQHLFLTSITHRDRGHLDIQAALVKTDTVTLLGDHAEPEKIFPGVLTEKYARHAQEWPMSVNDLALVLVVPKAITLRPGTLVQVREALWEVLVPHDLDEFKNEYEIGRRGEL